LNRKNNPIGHMPCASNRWTTLGVAKQILKYPQTTSLSSNRQIAIPTATFLTINDDPVFISISRIWKTNYISFQTLPTKQEEVSSFSNLTMVVVSQHIYSSLPGNKIELKVFPNNNKR
jgi:hypothetical protein